MPYTATSFNTGAGPGIDAPVLNAMQTQYVEAVSSFNGNLLTAFVLTGFVAAKDGTTASQLDVTTGTAYVKQTDGTLRQRTVVAFNESCVGNPSATLFLDLNSDGTLSWGTVHSGDANHLTLCTVTTDASANILTVTDTRPTLSHFLLAMIGTLDLPAGATSGGSKIWTAGNDGSGSGLDADTLDGHDSSYFAVAGSTSSQVDTTHAGSTTTPQIEAAANTGLSTQETTVGGKKHTALIPTEGDGTERGLSLGYVDASGTYHEQVGCDSAAGLKFIPTGAVYRATAFFSGTGAGTFSHGFPGTPSWVGITDSQSSSTMTVGVDTIGSSTCHVNTGASHSWLGMAHG